MGRLEIENDILVRTGHEDVLTASFREAGIKVIPCEDFTRPWRYLLNLKRVLAAHGPYDILHVHGFSFSSAETMLFARGLGVRSIVLHSHTDLRRRISQSTRIYKAYAYAIRGILRAVRTHGLACSSNAAEWLFGKRWESDQTVRIHYCGIDLRAFLKTKPHDWRQDLHIPPGRFVLGHVGRLEAMKNQRLILAILELLTRRGLNCHLILVGDGPLRTQIQEQAQKLGLSQRCAFISDSYDVSGLMRTGMDCFLLPSEYEGLGLVAVEAQAAGLPCLISDSITAEVVVEPRLVQFLTIEHGAGPWVEAVATLMSRPRSHLSDAELRLTMYSSHFNIDASTAELREYYKHVSHDGARHRELLGQNNACSVAAKLSGGDEQPDRDSPCNSLLG